MVQGGVDPLDKKADRRDEWTCGDLIEKYLEDLEAQVEGGSRAVSYLRDARSEIKNHIRPGLGDRKVSDVDFELIRSIQSKLLKAGKGTQSNRVMSRLQQLFKFAIANGQIAVSPAANATKMHTEKERDHVLTGVELVRLAEALNELESQDRNPVHLDAIRLIALTGRRNREVTKLLWSEVDFENECLALTRFKGVTNSSKKAKIVPLSQPAIDILRKRLENRISDHVFPSISRRSGKARIVPIEDLRKPLYDALEIAGIDPQDVVVHTLRHSFGAALVSRNVHKKVIGALLGHKSTSSTERYMHAVEEPQRQAAEAVAEDLGKVTGSTWLRVS